MSIHLRLADTADQERLGGIEDAADSRLTELFGPGEWSPSPSGAERAASPGFVLVSAETHAGPAVGFAHVVEQDDLAHLEQLSVLPEHGRRGHGRALVDAAKREARSRGYRELTLRTFADVPWNAPFYASCGFVEVVAATDFHHRLADRESELGLTRLGRRILMRAVLSEYGNVYRG